MPRKQRCRKKCSRPAEVRKNKAPSRQRCRRTSRQAGRGAGEQGARQAEVQENKAPGRQRCRRTRRPTDTGAEELGARQAEVNKNNRQKNKQAEKIKRRQTELQTTYLINGLFVRLRGAVLQNINQTTSIRKEDHYLFCYRKNWRNPKPKHSISHTEKRKSKRRKTHSHYVCASQLLNILGYRKAPSHGVS